MKATGIVRRIDDLGRIVIPKEIRRTLHIRETDPMEIFTDTEGQIILKKYSPIGDISTFAGKYAESLSDATGMTVCITDREQVIAASGDDKKNLMNKPVTKEMCIRDSPCSYILVTKLDFNNVSDFNIIRCLHNLVINHYSSCITCIVGNSPSLYTSCYF